LKVLRGLTAMEPVCAVAIARDGAPVEMVGVDPRAFALMKYAFANMGPRRTHPAARLAHDQAIAVARLVTRFGSKPFDPGQLAAFPVFAEQVEAGDPEAAKGVDDTAIHRGSGDFLADQGIEDPDEFRVKAHLCNEIASILDVRKLTQAKAAGITREMQADLSRIVNSRFEDYSVWRLIKILSALGTDVLIAVNPSGGNDRGVILSHTAGREEA
jgi:predicted XRE-type DNA-binding protein